MFKRFTWLAAVAIVRQLVMLLVNLLLMHRLSAEAFGGFALASATTLMLTGLSEFGLRQLAWARMARRPHRSRVIVGQTLSARAVTGSLATVLYCGLAWAFATSSRDLWVFALMAPSLWMNAIAFDFPSLAEGRLREYFTRLTAAYVGFAILVYALVDGDDSLLWAPLCWSAANAWMCWSLYRRFVQLDGRPILRFHRRPLVRSLTQATPLGVNFLMTRLSNNYPLLVLGLIASREQVADYRFVELFCLFVASYGVQFAGAAYSGLARGQRRAPQSVARQLERLVTLTGVLAGTAAIALWQLLSSDLASTAWPESPYMGHLIVLLTLGVPGATLSRMLKSVLPSLDMGNALATTTSVGVVAGVCLAVLGACVFGALGVAFSVMLCEISVCIALIHRLQLSGYPMSFVTIGGKILTCLLPVLAASSLPVFLGAPIWLGLLITLAGGLGAACLGHNIAIGPLRTIGIGNQPSI